MEELTTPMHAEFTVDAETEIKHKVFALLLGLEITKENILAMLDLYGVTLADVEKHMDEFLDLNNAK